MDLLCLVFYFLAVLCFNSTILLFTLVYHICFIEWLRINCMDVFHYVASELRGVSLFDNVCRTSTETGAIYNDFDQLYNPMKSKRISMSYSQPQTNGEDQQKNVNELVPQDEIDHAVLEAERLEGTHYEHLTFDSINFDCTSEHPDREYRQKVYNILKDEHQSIIISKEAREIFEIRKRNNWSFPDTVYDAWLLMQQKSRTWFPLVIFEAEHPEYTDIVKEVMKSIDETVVEPPTKRKRTVTSSGSDSSGENTDTETDNGADTDDDQTTENEADIENKSKVGIETDTDNGEGTDKERRMDIEADHENQCIVSMETKADIEADTEKEITINEASNENQSKVQIDSDTDNEADTDDEQTTENEADIENLSKVSMETDTENGADTEINTKMDTEGDSENQSDVSMETEHDIRVDTEREARINVEAENENNSSDTTKIDIVRVKKEDISEKKTHIDNISGKVWQQYLPVYCSEEAIDLVTDDEKDIPESQTDSKEGIVLIRFAGNILPEVIVIPSDDEMKDA